MDECRPKNIINEIYQRYNCKPFTALNLYQRLIKNRSCPTCEEIEVSLQILVNKECAVVVDKPESNGYKYYRLINGPHLPKHNMQMNEIYDEIKEMCMRNYWKPIALARILKEINENEKRIKDVCSILQEFGFIKLSMRRPTKRSKQQKYIEWSQDTENIYQNGEYETKLQQYSRLIHQYTCLVSENIVSQEKSKHEAESVEKSDMTFIPDDYCVNDMCSHDDFIPFSFNPNDLL